MPYDQQASLEDIYYCFRLILGRAPNPEEWPGHSSLAGTDLDAVVRHYINSLEFSKRSAALLERDFEGHYTLVRLPGFCLYVHENDQAVGPAVKQGNYEPHVTALFRDRLKQGMHVLDVGANVGYFSMLAASLVGPAGSVLAIEPNAGNVKLLEASRRANCFANITVLQTAAGSETGLLVLNTSYSNGTTAPLSDDLGSLIDATTVPCVRIDDVAPKGRRIDFIKIDVEGAEYTALSGARELIRRDRPAIASEFSPGMLRMISGIDGPPYLDFLLGLGYRVSVVETDGTLTACGADIAKVMAAYDASGMDHIDILLD